jgi:hypothetical protein
MSMAIRTQLPLPSEAHNIFGSEVLMQQSQAINKPGPKFDARGKVVPYSLVGRADWFIKNSDAGHL